MPVIGTNPVEAAPQQMKKILEFRGNASITILMNGFFAQRISAAKIVGKQRRD